MRLNIGNDQNQWIVLMLFNESACLFFKKPGFGQFERQVTNGMLRESSVYPVGRMPMLG